MEIRKHLLATLLVLSAAQLACGLVLEPEQSAALTADEQATLIAAEVESRLAATESLELALAMTLTAIASEQAAHAASSETPPAATATATATMTETATPTPTHTIPPATFIPPTKIPPTLTLQPTATPLPTNTPAPIIKSFIVYESDWEVDTLMTLLKGDHVSISASGEIWAGVAFTGTNGPNGWNYTDCGSQFPLPCAHPFSLLYWVNGQYYEAGESVGFLYTGSGGPLYLRINDDTPGNGTGSFNVTVTITR